MCPYLSSVVFAITGMSSLVMSCHAVCVAFDSLLSAEPAVLGNAETSKPRSRNSYATTHVWQLTL